MRFSNYHTHSRYCDGKNSPEELVREAIRLDCPELGFSGHSPLPGEDWCMSPEGAAAYREEIRKLQELYRGQLNILLGVEQDYYSETSTAEYDYVIGGVHSVKKDGVFLSVDNTRQIQIDGVRQLYGGDYYAFAEDYFALVGELWERTGCDVVAHFDLITKFNEGGRLFDPTHPRYRAAALSALDRLCRHPVIFEINTGAISRGYRSEAYPEPFFIGEIRRRGRPLILSSDCHDKQNLLFGFEELKARYPDCLEKLFGEISRKTLQ